MLGRRPCCNQLVSPKTSSPSTDYNNYFYNIFNGKNQEVNFFFFFFSLRCRFSEHMVNRGHLKETTCWQEQHLRGIRSSVEVFMSFPDIYLPQTFICKTLNLPLNLTVLLIAQSRLDLFISKNDFQLLFIPWGIFSSCSVSTLKCTSVAWQTPTSANDAGSKATGAVARWQGKHRSCIPTCQGTDYQPVQELQHQDIESIVTQITRAGNLQLPKYCPCSKLDPFFNVLRRSYRPRKPTSSLFQCVLRQL